MPIIVESKFFKLPELSEKAKHTAYDLWLQDFEHFDDFIIEDIKGILECLGFHNIKVWYSLGYSQGDHACFNARFHHKKGGIKELKANYPTLTEWHDIAKRINAIQRTNGYTAFGTVKITSECTVNIDSEYYHDHWSMNNESDFKAIIEDINNLIYKIIRLDYEDQTSFESFVEYADSNDFYFSECGKHYTWG